MIIIVKLGNMHTVLCRFNLGCYFGILFLLSGVVHQVLLDQVLHSNETKSNVTVGIDSTDPEDIYVYIGSPILACVLIAVVCTVFVCWKRKQAVNKRIIRHIHLDSDVSIRPASSISCEFDFERYCADKTRSYFGFESPEAYMTDDDLIVPGVLSSDI